MRQWLFGLRSAADDEDPSDGPGVAIACGWYQLVDHVLRWRDQDLGDRIDRNNGNVQPRQEQRELPALLGVDPTLETEHQPARQAQYLLVHRAHRVRADGQRFREGPSLTFSVDDGHVVGQEG